MKKTLWDPRCGVGLGWVGSFPTQLFLVVRGPKFDAVLGSPRQACQQCCGFTGVRALPAGAFFCPLCSPCSCREARLSPGVL